MIWHRLGLRRTETLGIHLEPEKVCERLRQFLVKLQPIDQHYRDPLSIGNLGNVSTDHFSFVWRQYHNQHLAPWLEGEIHKSQQGTFMLIYCKLQPHMQFFMGLALIICLSVSFLLLILYKKTILFAGTLVSLALVYLFVKFLFEQNCKKAIAHLYEELSAD